MIRIDVDMDYVVIEGKRIDRPRRTPRSQWLSYWDVARKLADRRTYV